MLIFIIKMSPHISHSLRINFLFVIYLGNTSRQAVAYTHYKVKSDLGLNARSRNIGIWAAYYCQPTASQATPIGQPRVTFKQTNKPPHWMHHHGWGSRLAHTERSSFRLVYPACYWCRLLLSLDLAVHCGLAVALTLNALIGFKQ